MASVYPKKINGKTYYYLREMGWIDGKPKMVSERSGIGGGYRGRPGPLRGGDHAGPDPASAVR